MRIVELTYQNRARCAVVESRKQLRLLTVEGGTYAVARAALQAGISLQRYIEQHYSQELVDYDQAVDLGLLNVPCMHPDPAHCYVTGTGLTHTGSAATRDEMHAKMAQAETLTDSMKMFKTGQEGGKPKQGEIGAEPEWFYKGDGSIVVAPNAAFPVPSFAEDAGEEPELVGIYVIDDVGNPQRIGFAVGNEFSDHVKERRNYLLLAHSKLRPCSIGPEIYLGELPPHLEGTSQILRNGQTLWEKPFLTGEANMVHSIANLEHHHFKYPQFRRPGDVHLHFFGTATLSFADDIQVQSGDQFSITLTGFGRPLINTVILSESEK